MKLLKCISIALLLIVTTISCKQNKSVENSISVEKPVFKKEGELSLFKSSGNLIRTIDIEIADTAYEQEVDLTNRERLKTHQGMLFLYPEEALRGYYMKDIRFPLDLIFINSDNKIVSFSENTTPLDDTTFLPSQVPAQLVLKISGGLSEEWVLEVGDYVEWRIVE